MSRLFKVVVGMVLYSIPLLGQWSSDPSINTPVMTQVQFLDLVGAGYDVVTIAGDGSGGAFIAWTELREVGGSVWKIYAQHLDALGIPQWPVNGVQVSAAASANAPRAVSDGNGGIFLAWRESGGIFLQRLDLAGALWPQPVSLSFGSGSWSVSGYDIIADGSGGVIVTGLRSRLNFVNLYAQRIDASGATLWGVDPVPACEGDWDVYQPRVSSDGSGGAIITWIDYRFFENDVFAQRIGNTGTPLWSVNGVGICVGVGNQQQVGIESDGAGGAIIAWEDYRSGGAIRAQRVTMNGITSWTTNGILVSSPDIHKPGIGTMYGKYIVTDGSGGAILSWRMPVNIGGNTVGFDIYAQRVDPSGVKLWTTDGVPVVTGENMDINKHPDMMSDGSGGAYVSWQDYRSGDDNDDIFVQRVNSSGQTQFTTNGVRISSAPDRQVGPVIAGDGFDGGIIAWIDARDSEVGEIYAQNFNGTGGLGGTVLSSIAGTVFHDLNGNLVRDMPSEYGIPNWTVRVNPGSLVTLTDGQGNYRFGSLQPGIEYTVTQDLSGDWHNTAPPGGSHVLTPAPSAEVAGLDFGNDATSSYSDLSISMLSLYPPPLTSACCQQDITYLITYKNSGTEAVTDAIISMPYGSLQTYKSSFGEPEFVSITQGPGNAIAWLFSGSLLPGGAGSIYVTMNISGCEPPASPDVVTALNISPTDNDVNTENNHLTHTEPAVCSYDPNDKQVDPGGCGPAGLVSEADSLTYTVRFQNTGTAPANRVILLDTLDADLDATTVQLLGTSHPFVYERSGQILSWTFPDIGLPASEDDEPGSHGYAKFIVHPGDAVGEGSAIENRAGIYFDLNDPVITNTVLNTITLSPVPVAAFTPGVDTVQVGETVDFTYTGGTAGASFLWEFGESANPPSSTDENPAGVIYTAPGTRLPILSVALGSCTSRPFISTIVVVDSSQTTCSIPTEKRWNLVSLPLVVTDPAGVHLFPGAITPPYSYSPGAGYDAEDTLRRGEGYWMKFSHQTTFRTIGSPIPSDSIEVEPGWNLIGSISDPVEVGTITSEPGGMVTSQFIGYSGGGYRTVTSIDPGKGYWVKVDQVGLFILSSALLPDPLSKRITIRPTAEHPPQPPALEEAPSVVVLPKENVLLQNYPNPFNPSVTIQFSLSQESRVSLTVYDLSGRTVATIVENQEYEVGTQRVEFNAANLAGGIYFYRLTAQSEGNIFSDVKKMLLLK